MAGNGSPREYKRRFILRVAAAREASGLSQDAMAAKLGITRDRYAKYEIRSLMPHWLIPEFCRQTGHHPWYILTGQPAANSPGSNPIPAAYAEID